jgi:hypothetical protein
MMRQVYLPEESDERLAMARHRRARRALVALVLLFALAAAAWLVFGRPGALLGPAGDGFRSEVVPPVPTVGPADSDWASRRAPYRVQVASVDTREKASEIATKLRVDGWSVDVVADAAERRFRVEVGPYVSRTEAERVVRELRGAWGAGIMLVERK